MADEMIEGLLAYCDDTVETTTSDAARLVRGIARLGKAYCDFDALMAAYAEESADARTRNLVKLTELATEMNALLTAQAETLAAHCKPSRSALAFAEHESQAWEEEEVLNEVRVRVGLRRLYMGQTWEELDESIKRDMRADALSDPNIGADWNHGDRDELDDVLLVERPVFSRCPDCGRPLDHTYDGAVGPYIPQYCPLCGWEG